MLFFSERGRENKEESKIVNGTFLSDFSDG